VDRRRRLIRRLSRTRIVQRLKHTDLSAVRILLAALFSVLLSSLFILRRSARTVTFLFSRGKNKIVRGQFVQDPMHVARLSRHYTRPLGLDRSSEDASQRPESSPFDSSRLEAKRFLKKLSRCLSLLIFEHITMATLSSRTSTSHCTIPISG